jgi:hypothetical protein
VPRSQLAINAPPELLERLRREAQARGVTATRLVIEALERHLEAGPPDPDAHLDARLGAIEARLGALEQRSPHPPAAPLQITHTGDAPAVDGALTGAQLAKVLGVGSSAINAWAGRSKPGQTYRGWELIGKVASPSGGPARWMFQQAAPAGAEQPQLDGI